MKVRSKFFRAAVEGDTVDGRIITRQDIEEMAASYDPKVYGARVWPEHFRGLIPGGPFDALGDIVAAKAETIKEGSELDGKLGLYVQVDALPNLVQLNATGQKIFHSVEVFRNFAKTGKAYLFGLAVTDTPASLGTQIMAFGADAGELFTGPNREGTIEFASSSEHKDDAQAGKPSLFTKVKELLGKNKGDSDKRFADMHQAIEATAQFAADLDKRVGETVPRAEYDALKTAHDQLAAKFGALEQQLSATPAPGTQARAPATGGDGTQLADY